ncbi:MAG: hypothetical protein K2W95_14170 [Candidatus Obscuribacterales bacterium]|nr:hypothetical protein [Candidatus Obscuribacterales bacterium]
MISRKDAITGEPLHRPINACLRPLCSLDGLVKTVSPECASEGLLQQKIKQHLRNLPGESIVAECPAVSHQALLTRLFKREGPFSEKDDDKGYRDALIWHIQCLK